jgi:hypothetical protein
MQAAKGPYNSSIMQNGIKIADGNDKGAQGKVSSCVESGAS